MITLVCMIFLLLDVITDSSSVFNTDYEYVIILISFNISSR